MYSPLAMTLWTTISTQSITSVRLISPKPQVPHSGLMQIKTIHVAKLYPAVTRQIQTHRLRFPPQVSQVPVFVVVQAMDLFRKFRVRLRYGVQITRSFPT